MGIKLPYPYPQLDKPENPWDSFALLRNLQFLAERIDSVSAVNQTTILFREVGDPIDTITGDTTEHSIFATTVLAGTLQTSHSIRLYMTGDVTNATGAARGFTLRTYLGGTVVGTFASTGLFASNATARGWNVLLSIHARDSLNKQLSYGSFVGNNTGVTGGSVTVTANLATYHNGLTLDASTNLVLAVTIQNEVNGVSTRPLIIIGEGV